MRGAVGARSGVKAPTQAAGGTEEIKKREINLKKMRAHLAAEGRCMVDLTNPVEWHEQMIAELPWPVRHGRALLDRQVAVNVEAQKLTQRLMSVTQQTVKSEAVMRQLEAERSALFASMEDHCLEKLESILKEYSACLTYAPTWWALVRELVRKDGVTPALARVNHRLKGTGLRPDFHFVPTRPSPGLPSSSRPSMNEHWCRIQEVESITIGLGLGLGRRGKDGALPVPGKQEDSSSGESVYFSASSDDNNNNNYGDCSSDDLVGSCQGDHSRSQEKDGLVSSCTRSRHGGLLAMVDAAIDCRVDGEEQRSDVVGGRQLHSRQVRQDGDSVER